MSYKAKAHVSHKKAKVYLIQVGEIHFQNTLTTQRYHLLQDLLATISKNQFQKEKNIAYHNVFMKCEFKFYWIYLHSSSWFSFFFEIPKLKVKSKHMP